MHFGVVLLIGFRAGSWIQRHPNDV